jgi:tRNA(Glu) U13 pseudouridine synthase TruD
VTPSDRRGRACDGAAGRRGLPNGFGEQRFGRGDTALRGRALVRGERLPSRPGAFERKLYVSAYQALLFNRMLEARLQGGTRGARSPAT